MPAKGSKMTPEQIQARQDARDRNRAAGVTKRGKRIKGSIPIFPGKPKKQRRKKTRRWVKANPADDRPARDSMEKKMLRMTLAALEIMVELMDKR